ncbi:cytochrome ubiquinol oxidase subunit I [Dendrosporobacter sp. 1207_IL3150]|uniref:cytochrome ubiquinol oxidase subunit I n=1 Tax=Dendrosporobacter sp. 1207_IL3150 TaxID=3084054 RepID=UPI002FDA08AA
MNDTALLLSRLQFGITLSYHFWFVALTLGLSVLIAIMQTIYLVKDKQIYKTMTRFWGKLFIVNYIVGVVTGIVQEFQFGMNWSEYSRFVGDVFGVPLAFEALTAFFIESTFIGIWVYGWDHFSRKVHLLAIWLVAISSNYSAFWILAANAFMQKPIGYSYQNGRLELADLSAIMMNPYLIYQYSHTVLSGLLTGGLFLMTVSAFYLIKQRHKNFANKSFKIGVVCAMATTAMLLLSGHLYTQYLVKAQPMKFAAMEAIWETTAKAPFSIAAIIDEEQRRNRAEISVPGMLSIMATNRSNSEVEGINELQYKFYSEYGQNNYIPPVGILFWSFRVKVAIGVLLLLLSAYCLWWQKKRHLALKISLLKGVMIAMPLIIVCHTAGWLIAELGRQPWIVYGLQLTEHGVSKVVPVTYIWISLISFVSIYAFIALVAMYIMRNIIYDGPETLE